MQTGFKWRWAYLPVVLVLGLIWYEFWRSGTLKDQGGSAPVVQEETKPAEEAPPAPATVVAVVTPASEPAKVVVAPVVPVVDPFDRLLKDPPPISISVQNASLKQTVNALNRSLTCDPPIALNATGQESKLITLEVKDQPFWDVLEAIEAQSPFDMQESGRGLTLRQYGQGVKQFERKGAAMLYATQLAYYRSVSGQSRGGDGTQPRMQLTLCAVIDPRVHVVRHTQIAVTEAVDEAGLPMELGTINTTSWMTGEDNCWQQSVSWVPPEKMGKRMARVRTLFSYTAAGGETEATIDDMENKLERPFDLGDRSYKLVRCQLVNTRLMVELVAMDEQPTGGKLTMSVTDSTGKQVGLIAGLSGAVTAGTAPYRLVINGQRTKDVAVALELHDLPMP